MKSSELEEGKRGLARGWVVCLTTGATNQFAEHMQPAVEEFHFHRHFAKVSESLSRP